MKFRPCIDIHNGSVKQIVGSSLSDENDRAVDNFVSEKNAEYYAELYKKHDLGGGHIILLNPEGSQYYEADCRQAFRALQAFPGKMQIGGGINSENAMKFIDAGASHVIVTSYVFKDGKLNKENLVKIVNAVGRERLVLDLSCRKRDRKYYIVTDRWQKFTDMEVNIDTLEYLSKFCDEFLIHAVDVEGKSAGIDEDLVQILSLFEGIPVTYAGGVRSFDDIDKLASCGKDGIDFTVGSALDIFGGTLAFEEVARYITKK